MKLISICIPVKNEEKNITDMVIKLKEIFSSIKDYKYEIIFTDNNSTDNSFNVIKDLKKVNPFIKGFKFSKDIGKERSLLFALKKTSGDAAIQLDCDFEDPPELIIEFLKKWEEGYQVINGIRKKRFNDKFSFFRFFFYRFLKLISKDNLYNDVGDFKLCDKVVIDKIKNIDDQDPYLRGIISSVGFNTIGIEHDRGKNSNKKSNFNFFSYLANSINGITNHSIAPLRLATFVSFFIFIFAIFLSLFYLFHYIFYGTAAVGFTTQTILILISIALNAFFIGIIGEYIGRIYRQLKKNDIFIVEEV